MAVLALCSVAPVTGAQDQPAVQESRSRDVPPQSLDGEHQAASTAADRWVSLEDALETAYQRQQPVFVYVRAPWCGPCYRLERDVFPRSERALNAFIKARVDLSEMPDPGYPNPDIRWLRRHGVDVPPSIAVVGPKGDLLVAFTGFLTAPELRHLLHAAMEEALPTSRRGRDDASTSPLDTPQ